MIRNDRYPRRLQRQCPSMSLEAPRHIPDGCVLEARRHMLDGWSANVPVYLETRRHIPDGSASFEAC